MKSWIRKLWKQKPATVIHRYKVGELVVTPFKNRWTLPCVGEVVSCDKGNTYTVEVFNAVGPGANKTISGIPESDLKAT